MTSYLLSDTDQTVAFGRALAAQLRAGDVLILTGPLGAGKTTLTRGIGQGLVVAGRVTSPTFTISRIHRAPAGAPDLVHVDAYRLTGPLDLETIDLDSTLASSVTVVEWGEQFASDIADQWLHIELEPGGADQRRARLTAVGERWRERPLGQALAAFRP